MSIDVALSSTVSTPQESFTAGDVVAAIHAGDTERLREILNAQPPLALEKVDDRTMLHQATDWPGNWPNIAASIALLVGHGADVNAVFPHPDDPDVVRETPLHWAASSGDAAAVDALLDAGAVVDSLGGIFGGCTPFEEAVIFEKYAAARRLLERGATCYLPGAAALGRMDLVHGYFDENGKVRLDVGMLPHWPSPPPAQVLLDRAFQFACRAGHLEIAKLMRARGADPSAQTPADTTPLDEAEKNGHAHVIAWLTEIGSAV